MSINRSVLSPRRARAHRSLAVALTVGFAAVASMPGAPGAGAAAVHPRRAPTPSVGANPVARIGELTTLVNERTDVVDAAEARRATTERDLGRARLAENLALAHADELGRIADAAQRRFPVARDRAGAVAAAMYRGAGQPEAIMRMLNAKSVADYGYRASLTKRVAELQAQVVRTAVRTRREAVAAAAAADRQKLRFHRLVGDLERALPQRQQELTTAQDSLARARFWLTRWQSIGAGVDTPIMSGSILSPTELTSWFVGTHRKARITVPMLELAQDYIDEGAAAKVRGDIAFAQSILETGSFYFPDGGQLTPTDNNFAGINACDSCAHGSPFPDARTGVRAQMQLLRVYADPSFSAASLGVPLVLPNIDHHFLKGRVPTWNGLTHTWATANAYGDRIISIYAGILSWLTDRAGL
ncbi:MAG: glucosaminidase domain-containing protein [Acidimicrobiia bacterium]